MPERKAQTPVHCGENMVGTLWQISGDIARAVLDNGGADSGLTPGSFARKVWDAHRDREPFPPESTAREVP
jgi:hypothetical protein